MGEAEEHMDEADAGGGMQHLTDWM